MQISINALSSEELLAPPQGLGCESVRIRDRVATVRLHQFTRQGCVNAALSAKACEEVCALGIPEQEFMRNALSRLKLSARGFHRLLKVARTIADMRSADTAELSDLKQALSFKQNLQAPL